MRVSLLSLLAVAAISGCSVNTTSFEAQKNAYDAKRINPTQTNQAKNTQTDTTKAIKAAPIIAKDVQDLIDKSWAHTLASNPGMAAQFGDESAKGKLTDMSPEALAQRHITTKSLLDAAKAIDRSELSNSDLINLTILQDQLQNQVDMYRFKDHYLPITAESGFHAYIASIANGRFKTYADYQHYLAKLEALPNYFAQQTFWLKQGLSVGITPAKVTLNGFENSISPYITEPSDSGYYQPFEQFPKHFTKAQRDELTLQGLQAIRDKVIPSYQAFYDFMTEEYIPNAREEIAASAMPDGEAFYANRVSYYTTLDMTADEVHQLGLKEVARIRAEMQQIIDDVEFKGSFADFLHFLRTDPQFYPKTAEELLKEASYIAKKADAMLPKYFGNLPRQPYGIAPVPAEIAPKYTTGRYSGSNSDDQPGYYWVNTYALEQRPLYELEALTLHEAVPGHHLQIALTKELDNLPNFRRYSYISAFGEGWGLYSEYLGLEAGFYQDPYSNFGRLTYEMWRAARLVVDTGMHAKGWTRQQAIDYMASNTALSMHNVTTEIDRYISWPGQALSYKIGELTIKRLRAKAENALGEDFDIRAFHDAVLENGSVPMPILEQMIDQFIAKYQS
ncbi:DUF885 domain-containing protein [Shewanella sp. WXL01]|uniref:DUF885 domain-containing protein n=1 Tax=Shewanella maritima TaxID=2520507 RepID=A0A411PH82_9GAMM|nr:MULTISPECIES: DUF885 domain-containing protein [Shewanella]NKF52557.1 DUF885 domain-containing protein [Shewanella sp. WXL01]QBF82961.1 DUF885 domain-containing protein [Shewanella maritima]